MLASVTFNIAITKPQQRRLFSDRTQRTNYAMHSRISLKMRLYNFIGADSETTLFSTKFRKQHHKVMDYPTNVFILELAIIFFLGLSMLGMVLILIGFIIILLLQPQGTSLSSNLAIFFVLPDSIKRLCSCCFFFIFFCQRFFKAIDLLKCLYVRNDHVFCFEFVP